MELATAAQPELAQIAPSKCAQKLTTVQNAEVLVVVLATKRPVTAIAFQNGLESARSLAKFHTCHAQADQTVWNALAVNTRSAAIPPLVFAFAVTLRSPPILATFARVKTLHFTTAQVKELALRYQ